MFGRKTGTNLLMLVLAGAASGLLIRMATIPGEGCHAPAQDDGQAKPVERPSEPIRYAVGNAKCPVMGGAVDADTPPVVVHGIAIGICCAGCDGTILKDVAGTLTKLMAEPESGPELREWLDAHKDVRRAAGLEPASEGVDAGHERHAARPESSDKRLTAVGNGQCPIDGEPAHAEHVAKADGLAIGTCSEGCRQRVERTPEPLLSKLARDPKVAARIEAAKDLERRGGHGPHFACATCKVRSGSDGPCPDCGVALNRAESEGPWVLSNPRCPIMGEVIEEGSGTSFVHDGIEVRICCPACEATFRQHPGYYLAKIEREQDIRIPRIVRAGDHR